MGTRRAPSGGRTPTGAGLAVLLAVLLVGCGGTSATTAQPGDSADGAAPSGTSVGATSDPGGPLGVEPGNGGGEPGSSGTSPTQVVTGTGGATGAGAPVPWSVPPTPSLTNRPRAASGTAKLTILLDNGFGVRTTWTLTCDPAGGTHPDSAVACGVLGAKGTAALPEPRADLACTEQYGGPQKAKITGRWRGTVVNAQLSLENGCQISRWEALLGLLPPGGVTG